MSSTLRSKTPRHQNDYYVTPIDDVVLFLKELESVEGNIFEGKKVLDPSAGGDAINVMSYPTALVEHMGVNPKDITTIDIRQDSRAEIKGDYLKLDMSDKFDVVITNPPFNLSLDMIKKALSELKEGGYAIFLVRLNYFGSKARKEFWDTILPKYTFVHSKRISFTPDGKKDSIEYMHIVFKKGEHPNYTELRII